MFMQNFISGSSIIVLKAEIGDDAKNTSAVVSATRIAQVNGRNI